MATLLTTAADQRPRSPALADERAQRDWGTLDARVNRWVHALRAGGLATGDAVAVVAGNRVETFELVLACLHSGLTVVPVNDRLTAGEIAYQLRDCGARAVVTEPARATVVADAVVRCGTAPAALVFGAHEVAGFRPVEPMLAAAPAGEPPDQVCGSTMLY